MKPSYAFGGPVGMPWETPPLVPQSPAWGPVVPSLLGATVKRKERTGTETLSICGGGGLLQGAQLN